jgi:hypothetical protein
MAIIPGKNEVLIGTIRLNIHEHAGRAQVRRAYREFHLRNGGGGGDNGNAGRRCERL